MSKSPRNIKPKKSKKTAKQGQRRTAVPRTIPSSMAEMVGALVAVKGAEAFDTFIVAGAQVLQEQYGFSKEQAAEWATATTRLGGFYLRMANKERGRDTAVQGGGDEPTA